MTYLRNFPLNNRLHVQLQIMFLAVEWTAAADEAGTLVFDVVKEGRIGPKPAVPSLRRVAEGTSRSDRR